MRSPILFVPILAACAASHAPEAPTAESVKARLAHRSPTKLMVSLPDSSGTLTASHYTHEGWVDGSVALGLANGELDARVDGDNLEVTGFAINVNPIDLPSEVFGKPATLKDLRVMLNGTPQVTTTWTDDDHATATAMISLDLSWTIVVDGNAAPLGTQHLAPLPIDLELTGDGDEVDAAIGVHAAGTLWSWADLVKLTALDLELAATTAY